MKIGVEDTVCVPESMLVGPHHHRFTSPSEWLQVAMFLGHGRHRAKTQ
jgi:hypothetical protein